MMRVKFLASELAKDILPQRKSAAQNILSKKAAPQMAASVGHFKLVKSHKRKSYRPRRRLQYQKATAERPSKSPTLITA